MFVAEDILESETAFSSQVTFEEYIGNYTPITPHVTPHVATSLETIQNQIQSLSMENIASKTRVETDSEMYYEEDFEPVADEFDAGY